MLDEMERIGDDASEEYLEQVTVGREYSECCSTTSAHYLEERSTAHRDRMTWTWVTVTWSIDARPKLAFPQVAYVTTLHWQHCHHRVCSLTGFGMSDSDDDIEIVEKSVGPR